MTSFPLYVAGLFVWFQLTPVAQAAPKTSVVPARARMTSCLQQAAKAANPMARDEKRFACLRNHGPKVSIRSCLAAARGFEYSDNAEDMHGFCLFESDSEPKVADCKLAARGMQYGDSRDSMLMTCIQRLNLSISRHQCRQLVSLMVNPVQSNRATSYCLHEIRAAID